MKKYAVHPGIVRSRTDGQEHRIGYHELIRLYGVSPSECIRWDISDPWTTRGRDPDDYVHLYPRHDGKYEIREAGDHGE